VVEIASGTAVAYCAKLLAQLGAEVVRIEPPGGDDVRRAGPFPGDVVDLDRGGLHGFLNAGKSSVTLDLADGGGADLARRLIEGAELLVASWKTPGALPLADTAAIGRLFPGTTYVSISEFGMTGPYAGWSADSHVIEAMSGIAYVSGAPDREPLTLGVDAADFFAGTTGWIASLVAIAQREVGEAPSAIDVSALEALAASDDHSTSLYVGTGAIRRRYYSRVLISYPSDIMPCRDGYIAFVPGGLDFAKKVAALIQRPELESHPLLATPRERVVRWREFDELVRPWLLSHTADELLGQSDALHMAFAAVATVDELLRDPHLHDRGYWTAGRDGGPVPGPPARFSETPMRDRGPAMPPLDAG
jgi:crotonobetainyl-CoA:carnitine CoA-transferase CaiB-like acyl-CoA transferase